MDKFSVGQGQEGAILLTSNALSDETPTSFVFPCGRVIDIQQCIEEDVVDAGRFYKNGLCYLGEWDCVVVGHFAPKR